MAESEYSEVAPAEPKVADPAPLGLAALALATFAFSVVNAGLLGEEAVNHFIPLALIYGGLAQFIAGMWEFRSQNTFAATDFTSYGAFWMTLGNPGDLWVTAGGSGGAVTDRAGLDIHGLGYFHPLHVVGFVGR